MKEEGVQRLRRIVRQCVLFLVFAGAVAPLHAQEMQIPQLKNYATDLSGTLTREQLGALETKLQQFDKTTSTQIVVFVVPTLGTSSIEDASLRVAEANGIGRKGKDNGALLFIAMQERRVRIEVGYGLEGALPDAIAGLIIRREIGPSFREGNYYAGIDAGVNAIMLATKNEYTARPDDRREKRSFGMTGVLLALIFFVFILRLFRGRRSSGPGGFWWWGGFPSGGGGGSGSGGGGSFGGFSGGGGSFGGGGASGSW